MATDKKQSERVSVGKPGSVDDLDTKTRKVEVEVHDNSAVAIDPNTIFKGAPDSNDSPTGIVEPAAAGALAQAREFEKQQGDERVAEMAVEQENAADAKVPSV